MSKKGKLFTMQIIDAVGASALPADLKLLVFAMAHLANGKTGCGLSSQETIGRFVSCSEREVRRKLDRLDAHPNSPVRVVRQYRQRRDGRGRTSDEYRIELTNRTPTSAETRSSTGRPRPDERPRSATNQPDAHDGPTGRPRPNQPDAHVRGSSQVISLEDQRSLFVEPDGSTGPRPKTPKKVRSKGSPKHTPEQQEANSQLTKIYFEAYEAARGSKPIGWGKAEGASVYVLLTKTRFDVARAAEIIRNGLAAWDQATIRTIAADPDKYQRAPRKTVNGRVPAPQHGSSYDLEQYEVRDA